MARIFFQLLLLGNAIAWMDLYLNPRERALKLVQNMTIFEKLELLHGSAGEYVGNVAGNLRLGIPSLNMNDGPQGFRDDAHPGTSTQWPSALTIAATWDLDIANAWGSAMGEEFKVNQIVSQAFMLFRVKEQTSNLGLV